MNIKRKPLLWGLSITMVMLSGALWAAEGPQDYTIGIGDVLYISVWKDEALTKSLVVLPDGKISFPLIGELMVNGKTVNQIRDEVAAKIIKYVPDVVLSVDIQKVNSMVVYVIGNVQTGGRLLMEGDFNVLQALASAGGFKPFAKKDKIKIFRREGAKTVIHPFNYEDVIDGKNPGQNFLLKRGDIIVVP
jgi:polysaccharide export outer membrane protein